MSQYDWWIAKISSNPEYGYIPNISSCFLLFEQSGGQINIVYEDFLSAERGQDTLRSDVMPDREGHLCIGNGLLTDFETATYQVDRQVDAVYYLVGDYLELPGLAQAEFEQVVADAVLLWER